MTKNHDPVPPVNNGPADARRGPASRLAAAIEDLERATEGSRPLDLDIVHAVWPGRFPKDYAEWPWNVDAPEFTTSLDDALSLVPEGWHWSIYDTDGTPGRANAQVEPPEYSFAPLDGGAPSAALALCIAALKARLSSLQEESDAVGEQSSLSDG